jgi:hypothetical protein
MLSECMIRIVNRDFKWICEHCRSFFKRNAMLLMVEKILALLPFNGAFSGTARQVTVSIFVLKMVTRASMQLNLLPNYLSEHMRQHFPPPGPVVIHVSTPQIQRVRDSF